MEPFAHLHNHTEYSPLDGLQRMDEMMLVAKSLGQNSIAMTDHGTMAGVYQFAQAARRHGIKGIAGIEAYLAIGSRHERNVVYGDAFEGEKERRYHHLTILAKDHVGWRNLVLLNNDASLNVHYKPRMDFDSIEQFSDGLILGTGCLGGPVASSVLAGDMPGAYAATERLLKCVKGDKDRLFVEVMNHDSREEVAVLSGLHDIATHFGLRMVATNDAHYTRTEQAEDHNLLLAIQTNARLDDPDRFQFGGDRSSYFMRSLEQMRAAFNNTPITDEALTNSQVIADMCDDGLAGFLPQEPPPGMYRLPIIAVPDEVAVNFTPGRDGCANVQQFYLRHLVMVGAHRRHGAIVPAEVRERIERELSVIFGFGVENYFLIVWELIMWCRANNVPTGPGRGSGAGCEIAYCLTVTGVPPLQYDLLFERFLDPTRVGMPDFDLDFPESSLGPILVHLQEVYGYDHVARIGTLGSKLAKGMIRDVGRLIEENVVADKMAKMVLDKEGGGSYSLKEMLDPEKVMDDTFRQYTSSDPVAGEVLRRALPLDGISAKPSIHACGIVISDRPLVDLIPMRAHSKKGEVACWVTQWEAPDLEAMGFLKLDRLGLRNLDIIAETLASIEAATGERIDISYGNLPLTGPKADKAWKMLSEGRTTGVFQADSEGMTKLMVGMGMHSLEDISMALALYRPGPMGDGMHTRLVALRQGHLQMGYDHFTSNPDEQKVIANVLSTTSSVICVAKGEKVYSATRRAYIPVEDIVEGELVQGVDAQGKHAVAPVSVARMTGRDQRVVKLTTAIGTTLRLTPNHQVYTAARGWVEAGHLEADDVIAMPRELLAGSRTPFSSTDLSKARLVGYLLGDGGLTTRSMPTFTKSDPTVVTAFRSVLRDVFPQHDVVPVPSAKVATVRIVSNSQRGGAGGTKPSAILTWLRSLGMKDEASFGPHSRNKRIPSGLLAADPVVLTHLLAALWDCDGRVSASSPNRGMTYKTISKGLAADIELALLRLGIMSTTTAIPYINEISGSHETAYSVYVQYPEYLASILLPMMTHTDKREQARALANSTRESSGLRGTCGSSVPTELARSILSEAGWTKAEAVRALGLRSSNLFRADCVGDRTIQALAEATGIAGFERLAANRWVRIESVESDGTSDVYDLTVPELHSFIANGMVIHNCYQEQIMLLSGDVAGFGPGLKNKLRKAISKKKGDEFKAIKDKFMRGAVIATTEGGFIEGLTPEGDTTSESMAFDEKTAETLWRTFEASAAYLFNKSHSVAYGWITWITAYLKANYPDHYAAALLGVTDGADKRLPMLHALRGEGLTVLGPDINEGEVKTAVTAPGTIRLGMGEVRDVKKNAADLVAIREAGGPFTSLSNLIERAVITNEDGSTKKISTTIIKGLIESGALDSLMPESDHTRRAGMVQTFAALPKVQDVEVPDVEWPVWEKAARERHRLGIVVSQHPMSALGPQILESCREFIQPPSLPAGLHNLKVGDRRWVVGLLRSFSVSPMKSKPGNIGRFVLEGAKASNSGVMFNADVNRLMARGLPVPGQIVAAFVTVRSRSDNDAPDADDSGGIDLICNDIRPLDLLAHDTLVPDAVELPKFRSGVEPIFGSKDAPGGRRSASVVESIIVESSADAAPVDPVSESAPDPTDDALAEAPADLPEPPALVEAPVALEAEPHVVEPADPASVEWHDIAITSSSIQIDSTPRAWKRASTRFNAPGFGEGLSSEERATESKAIRTWRGIFEGIGRNPADAQSTYEGNLGTDGQGRRYRLVHENGPKP